MNARQKAKGDREVNAWPPYFAIVDSSSTSGRHFTGFFGATPHF